MARRSSFGMDYDADHSPAPKKGHWAVEDDNIIRREVEHGNFKWSDIAKRLHSIRTGKQCRERWANHLNPALKKSPWTDEEDEQLLAAQAVLGNVWTKIAKTLDGRSENEVKNRWYSALNKKARHRSTHSTHAAHGSHGKHAARDPRSPGEMDVVLSSTNTADSLDSLGLGLGHCGIGLDITGMDFFDTVALSAQAKSPDAVFLEYSSDSEATDHDHGTGHDDKEEDSSSDFQDLVHAIEMALVGNMTSVASDTVAVRMGEIYLRIHRTGRPAMRRPSTAPAVLPAGSNRADMHRALRHLPFAVRQHAPSNAFAERSDSSSYATLDELSVASFLLETSRRGDQQCAVKAPRHVADGSLQIPVTAGDSANSSLTTTPRPMGLLPMAQPSSSSTSVSSYGWVEDVQRLLCSPPMSPVHRER